MGTCVPAKLRVKALVLIEGIYSLDGDKAVIKDIIEVCERYDAVLCLDDAHGTGTLGAHGRGILEEQGLAVYEPDVAAFRERVQTMYLDSEYAETWPEGLLEKINALGN